VPRLGEQSEFVTKRLPERIPRWRSGPCAVFARWCCRHNSAHRTLIVGQRNRILGRRTAPGNRGEFSSVAPPGEASKLRLVIAFIVLPAGECHFEGKKMGY